jgi:hypothetical protein
MTKYLISFPSPAMEVADEELPAVAAAAHAVIDEAKAAGVFVFSGGIDEGVPPVLVDAGGGATPGTYPETRDLNGGMAVIEASSRDEAVRWAAKIAAACRCRQELREFQFDPLA